MIFKKLHAHVVMLIITLITTILFCLLFREKYYCSMLRDNVEDVASMYAIIKHQSGQTALMKYGDRYILEPRNSIESYVIDAILYPCTRKYLDRVYVDMFNSKMIDLQSAAEPGFETRGLVK